MGFGLALNIIIGSSPSSNPKGPDSGTNRVLRGGSWNYYKDVLRSADRARNFLLRILATTSVFAAPAMQTRRGASISRMIVGTQRTYRAGASVDRVPTVLCNPMHCGKIFTNNQKSNYNIG